MVYVRECVCDIMEIVKFEGAIQVIDIITWMNCLPLIDVMTIVFEQTGNYISRQNDLIQVAFLKTYLCGQRDGLK